MFIQQYRTGKILLDRPVTSYAGQDFTNLDLRCADLNRTSRVQAAAYTFAANLISFFFLLYLLDNPTTNRFIQLALCQSYLFLCSFFLIQYNRNLCHVLFFVSLVLAITLGTTVFILRQDPSVATLFSKSSLLLVVFGLRLSVSHIARMTGKVWVYGFDLRSAKLDHANLSGASAPWAIFNAASMAKTDFSNGDLRGARLTEVDGPEVIMQGSKLKSAVLRDCNMQGAILANASFDGATMTRSNFDEAILCFASMASRITDCSFTNADLRAANFRHSRIERSCFTGAQYDKDTIWPAQFNPGEHGAVLAS